MQNNGPKLKTKSKRPSFPHTFLDPLLGYYAIYMYTYLHVYVHIYIYVYRSLGDGSPTVRAPRPERGRLPRETCGSAALSSVLQPPRNQSQRVQLPRAPSMSTLPTLGPKVHKYDVLWAVWSPRVRVPKWKSGPKNHMHGMAFGTKFHIGSLIGPSGKS